MKWVAPVLFLITATVVTGCSTTMTINTKPEGVLVKIGDKDVGRTPLTISTSEYKKNAANGLLMRLSMAGYKSVWMWAPAENYDYTINVNLTPFYLRAGNGGILSEHEIARSDLNKLTDQMLSLQQALILGEQYDKNILSQLVEANPTLGSAHFLMAVDKIREQQEEQGIINLRDALRFSPAETDFLVLFNELNSGGASAN